MPEKLQSLVPSIFVVLLFATMANAQLVLPDITAVPARLERNLSTVQLVKLLEKGSAAQRTRAASYLGRRNARDLVVYRALTRRIKEDESKWVRRAAVKAVHKLFGEKARPQLRFALNDKDFYVAHSARNALGN